VVDARLLERDEFITEIHNCLEQAQQHHKEYYDRKHRPVDFEVGQWVWLWLLHWPMAMLDVKGRGKLGPCFFRPFQITEKIDDVAYRLQLPAGAQLHNVFHVGLLKKFHGDLPQVPLTLPPLHHGRVFMEPEQVLKCRLTCPGVARAASSLEGHECGRHNLDVVG
jgi:hypothetical protein